jgi:hypothetical protein
MSRAGKLLSAALLRPMNLVVLGAGLLLALTWAPWWIFPLSVAAYGGMVALALRDPAFVRRATSAVAKPDAGQPIDWAAVGRELGQGPWAASLERVAAAERNLAREFAQSPETARVVLASTLAQVRSAANLGIKLARRLRSLDYALQGYAGMDPERSRREAEDKRQRAARASDPAAQRALSDAAKALDESAQTAGSLRTLRERTTAQLESLSAMLESVAVRGVRLRVRSDGSSEIAETLGTELDAVRETLGVLESIDAPAAEREGSD